MKKIEILIFSFLLTLSQVPLYGQDAAVTHRTGIESEISITVNPNNEEELIIASMGTNSPIIVYTSTDGGMNWSTEPLSSGIADPVLTYGDNNTAYLSYLDFGTNLEMSLAQSTDNGENWNIQSLSLDGMAADRQWIKRDNTPGSPFYGNTYLAYFHPEGGADIHIVTIDNSGTIGSNHAIHSSSYTYVQNPSIAVASDGTIVINFIAENQDGQRQIVSVSSSDGGDTFSSEVIISDLFMYASNGNPVADVIGFAPGDASRLGNSLQMAVDNSSGASSGRFYLTWTDFVEGNAAEGMNIYLSFSDDQGTSWSSPQMVNDDNVPSSHQYYSGIDVNPNGILCLSWYDRRVDSENDALTDFYFTYSTDGGENFATSVKVNSASSNHTAVTNGLLTFGVGEYTSLASTSTDAYVVWSDGRENDGDMDVYFAKLSLDDINNIQEVKLSPGLSITNLSPNPVFEQKISVALYLPQPEDIEITVLNTQGQVLKHINRSIITSGENLIEIDLTETAFLPGNYFLKIKHKYGVSSKKFIILEQ